MKTRSLLADEKGVETAARLLTEGEVVALPTETVYGLAGNAFDPKSVEKIFWAKERPSFDPLIVHVGKTILQHASGPLTALVEQGIVSEEVLSWPFQNELKQAMTRFWPGPLTLVLPRGHRIPDVVTSGQETVGIRIPAHPEFQAVLQKLSFPLAAPSANRFGRISPTTAEHCLRELEGRIAAILDGGPCEVGVESTIISVTHPLKLELLRPGKVSKSELEPLFKVSVLTKVTLGQENQAQLAPGMLDQHYAPRKPLLLIPNSIRSEAQIRDLIQTWNLTGNAGILTQKDGNTELRAPFEKARLNPVFVSLSENGSPEEVAKNLFSKMRQMDENPNVSFLMADLPEDFSFGIAAAIADRLNRASLNKPLKTRS